LAASILKRRPNRREKEKEEAEKKPEPPYITFSPFLGSFSLLLLFFLTFCMTKKMQHALDYRRRQL